MMKAWRSLSRNLPSEISGKSGDVREALWLHSCTSKAGISTVAQGINSKGSVAGRVFAPYAIYKGKASLSIEPILPKFAKLDSGDMKVERKGVMLLTFVPAIGERKYDYQKKQCFALSPTEVGSLINMGHQDSADFFHDPSMLSSNAGQVRKSLSIKAQDGGNGYFFSLSVVNNILKSNERLSVPVTAAEFAVVKTACNFVLPHLMGWNRLANQSQSVVGSLSKVDQKPLDWETEWAK